MRRTVVALQLLVLLVAPLAAEAQAVGRVPRVGILWIASKSAVTPLYERFRQGLRDLDYVEGQTIVIEARYADGRVERLASLAEELVRLKVDVIVAPSTPAVRAAKQATTVIPIVMANVSDPVAFGFVASLARPGGNITGVANLTVELAAKNLELLKEAVPKLSRVAVLVNPSSPDAGAVWKEAQAGARHLGLKLHLLEARGPNDLEGAVTEAIKQRSDGLLVSTIEGLFFEHRSQIIEAAVKHRLPAVYAAPPYELARSGALMAYGASSPALIGHAATYVDRILKGAKPADLPVEQATTFELAVNLTTAKTLGLTIPPSVLMRANQVIQ
jgi:putative ABC transport system substrate-binding protein